METQRIEERNIEQIVEATPYLLKFPYRKMWIDYDKEADVLYINFKRPQKATDSEMIKNGILLVLLKFMIFYSIIYSLFIQNFFPRF